MNCINVREANKPGKFEFFGYINGKRYVGKKSKGSKKPGGKKGC